MKVVELSGGKQQEVVIAKSLVQDPVSLFSMSRHAASIGAIVEIHELIQLLADEGKAVAVISSYPPESALFPIADVSLHRNAMCQRHRSCDRGVLIVINTIETATVMACHDGVAVVEFHPLPGHSIPYVIDPDHCGSHRRHLDCRAQRRAP
jgi:hypothetical protein